MLSIIYIFYTIPETYHWIKVMYRQEDKVLLTFHLLYLSTSFLYLNKSRYMFVCRVYYKVTNALLKYKNVDIKFSAHDTFLE